MKIEITDRQYFKRRCEKALLNIVEHRACELAEVELDLKKATEQWRNKTPWLRKWRAKRPYPDNGAFWWRMLIAKETGSLAEGIAEKAIQLLESEGTGAIFLEAEEWNSIDTWANKPRRCPFINSVKNGTF